jgi:hypothetical protein
MPIDRLTNAHFMARKAHDAIKGLTIVVSEGVGWRGGVGKEGGKMLGGKGRSRQALCRHNTAHQHACSLEQ